MAKGIPKEHASAIRIAVDGAVRTAVASGIIMTAVAVLLINADSRALARQKISSVTLGSSFEKATIPRAPETAPEASSSLPMVMPPAINSNVDQSIRDRSDGVSKREANRKAAAPNAIT